MVLVLINPHPSQALSLTYLLNPWRAVLELEGQCNGQVTSMLFKQNHSGNLKIIAHSLYDASGYIYTTMHNSIQYDTKSKSGLGCCGYTVTWGILVVRRVQIIGRDIRTVTTDLDDTLTSHTRPLLKNIRKTTLSDHMPCSAPAELNFFRARWTSCCASCNLAWAAWSAICCSHRSSSHVEYKNWASW